MEPKSSRMITPDRDRNNAAQHDGRASLQKDAAADAADLPEEEWGVSKAAMLSGLCMAKEAGYDRSGTGGRVGSPETQPVCSLELQEWVEGYASEFG
ncbi:hypothetical protein NDU88_007235 [Pleurodeles waltl]|uniref:Uncharacterized protein n=1 Tax=Pleurodeles waltl TaxID=8319 RepID=A0AAV7SS88_PLEWA|nr:hypothetical protein NDU88_007235 [Pleurodeles waltl]